MGSIDVFTTYHGLTLRPSGHAAIMAKSTNSSLAINLFFHLPFLKDRIAKKKDSNGLYLLNCYRVMGLNRLSCRRLY